MTFTVNIVTDVATPGPKFIVGTVVANESEMLSLEKARQLDVVLRSDTRTLFFLAGTDSELIESWKELATSDGSAQAVALAEEVDRALQAEEALEILIANEASRAATAEEGLTESIDDLATTVAPAYQQAILSALLTNELIETVSNSTGFVYAITDEAGRVALGITSDGAVVAKLELADGVVTATSLAPELGAVLPEVIGTPGYSYVVTDESDRIAFWVTTEGKFGYSDIDDATKEMIVAAIGAAVADLVEVSLPVGESSNASGVAFSVVDDSGRRTWLEAGLDGKPSDHSASLIAQALTTVGVSAISAPEVSDTHIAFVSADSQGAQQVYLQELESGAVTNLPADGETTAPRFIDSGSQIIFLRKKVGALAYEARWYDIATANEGPVFSEPAWAAWGDSLTAGGWTPILSGLIGETVYNGGIGGQGASHIAARQGGAQMLVTVAGNQLPAAGAVALTAWTVSALAASSSVSRAGSIAGVAGTLTFTQSTNSYSFTRSVDGAITECPPNTPFIPTDGTTRRANHVVLWMGRNGFKTSTHSSIVALIQACIDYLSPLGKRFLVLEIPPGDTETPGATDRTSLDAMNAALAAAFPNHYVEVATWLRTEGAADAAGITFSPTDITNISNGVTPASFRSDGLHFNTAGNTAIAHRIQAEAESRGWL